MKIVQIGSFPMDSSCIKGGVESSVYGLVSELSVKNQVIVIDIPRTELTEDSIETVDAVTVYRHYTGGITNYSALTRIKSIVKIIKSLEPDICHIHSTSLFSFILYLLLRGNRIPTMVTVHGLAHIEKKNVWKQHRSLKNMVKYYSQSLTEFLFLSICPQLIVDTPYVSEAILTYKKQCKIMRLPICHVIPQGINPVFYELESLPNKEHLLSVGSISRRKGHLYLIEVLVKVGQQFPEFRLDIVGSVSDKDYLKNLQTRIRETGLEQNIHIIPNAPFEQILSAYSMAEIFVLHSEEESQGIVFCEAMAAGKAIVATNVGGIPWVIENNVNGLLSDYGDIDTFAKHIITLLTDENLRMKMEKANRLQSQNYDWKIISEEIINLYKLVIASH